MQGTVAANMVAKEVVVAVAVADQESALSAGRAGTGPAPAQVLVVADSGSIEMGQLPHHTVPECLPHTIGAFAQSPDFSRLVSFW